MAYVMPPQPKKKVIYRSINNCLWESSRKMFDGIHPVQACKYICSKTGDTLTYNIELHNRHICQVIRCNDVIVETARCDT